MRVENDEMYADWAHWLEAPCPVCNKIIRVHHTRDFASVVCEGCRQNPILHFCGVSETRRHARAMTKVLLAEGILLPVAADVAGELKADATLQAFIDFLLSLHYVKPEGLEALVKKKAAPGWQAHIQMTYNPQMPATAPVVPQEGARVNLTEAEIGADLVKRVPRTVARVYRCVPIRLDGTLIVLAVDDPEKSPREDLEGLLGCEVRLVSAPRAQITSALKKHYGAAGWQEALW